MFGLVYVALELDDRHNTLDYIPWMKATSESLH